MTANILTLSDGGRIPAIAYGLGTSHSKNYQEYFGTPKIDTEQVLTEVLKGGYRHVDTAEHYEKDEELAAAISKSGIPRKELYILSKADCNNGLTVDQALTNQLRALNVEYLDAYLIHNPRFAKTDEDLRSKWREMEAAYKSGRVKTIGVSNFTKKQIEAILKTAEIRPTINQFEYHPYEQNGDLIPWLREQKILVSAYSALGPVTRLKPGPLGNIYSDLARKYEVAEEDIALKWILDQGFAVATSGLSLHRLRDYLATDTKFKLTTEEIEKIRTIGLEKKASSFYQMGGVAPN
ncbi:hypothetical protein NLG97_g1623 [Lecanicillium saksenae]|uniref:Uncharacterized protein n=1 Tax=Lecanicillium saksenae TaxID=468837 RepID=A0ACC1R384_9HYPO|nr:hypothetical protein NLG97_g1623 [Lecanicillium saksenae]